MKKSQKDKLGRPSKFDPKFTDQLIKFFDIAPYKKEIMESSKEYFATGELKKESIKYKHMPNKMPTLYSFSRSIGVAYSTVWRWAEKGESEELKKKIDQAILEGNANSQDIERLKELNAFCNAYKEAKELQKEFLISIGLAGAAPAPFAIFTAKNVTDMRDSTVVTHNMPKPLLDAIYNNDGDKKTSEAETED